MVNKTAGALAQIKAVVPNCTRGHCILPHQIVTINVQTNNFFKKAASLKIVLAEAA